MEIILILLSAAIMEAIDAGLGMGYGTVLAPLLILFGYEPSTVVPGILLSQAIGGFVASRVHHGLKNANFEIGKKDFKIFMCISSLGIVATVGGAFLGTVVSKDVVKMYIGVMVTIVGILMLIGKRFKFSWSRVVAVGAVAAFNKGLSGGGFGPLVTGGQVVAGNETKSSIGCTTFAEAPICVAAFLVYFFTNSISDYRIIGLVSAGAAIGAPLGAYLTNKVPTKFLYYLVAGGIVGLGVLLLCGFKA